METTLSQVTTLCQKLTGHEACHQLVSRLCRDMSFGKMAAFAKAWADRDDLLLELPWGKYQSKETIAKCLTAEDGQDRSGILDIHCAVTECLEVADDAQTARGCWMFQSITTDKSGEARWVWFKADICFVPENGAWKVWRMSVYPMFNAEFTEDWGKLKPTDWDKLAQEKHPDAPLEEKPWHLGDPIRLWECYPPKPYTTWTDTVLGREPK